MSTLSVIRFLQLETWSINNINTTSIASMYKKHRIQKYLSRAKNTIKIEDDISYKRIKIKLYGKGVVLRDEVLGKDIGTKRQFIAKRGQLIISRIDARNGAFGIVPPELDGAIVTNDFLLFDVSNMNINFLVFLLSMESFLPYWQSKSKGTTNRQRVDEFDFLKTEIPLPDIETQNKLVNEYNNLVNQAEKAEKNALELEDDIERYLFEKLNIQFSNNKNEKFLLRTTKFSELNNRWEISSNAINVNKAIMSGDYKCLILGNHFDLTTRTWKKSEHNSKNFNYIEISSIDPEDGVINKSTLNLDKAPSRATQIVKTNDLIIGLTRPYLKKFALITADENNDICSSAFQTIRENESYNLEFLKYVLMSDIGIKQFEILMTGALYPAINQMQLSSMLIPVPPLEIQNEIATTIFDMKNKIKQLKTQATELRQLAKKQFEEEIFGE